MTQPLSNRNPQRTQYAVSDVQRWVHQALPVEDLLEARGFGASSFESEAWDTLVNHLETVAPTEPNIPGPFYKPNAPFRAGGVIAPRNEPGPRLSLNGGVMNEEGEPLSAAVLDIWQATNVGGRGAYDTRPDPLFPAWPPSDSPTAPIARDREVGYHLRGRVRVNEAGLYAVETVRPGIYPLNDEQDRPAHVHVKATAPGHQPLTTQLYFPDDALNKNDPFFLKGLLVDMDPASTETHQKGTFDFVLRPT